ncbi:MAG TPA: hypothetical protein VNN07_15360, partial [Candidatus Tectomicrobia bacterium]|nr:hypothetical protein [Candidatus Tectomicrobia bacterium]
MTTVVILGLAILALAAVAPVPPAAASDGSSVRVLDTFEDLAPWTAVASDGVRAAVGPADGPRGRALRLDFDLGGTAGYALARRALALDV